MFIFKAPKRRCIQKSASKDGQEILNRLNEYLDGNADEPAKFLVNFWKDQGNAFSYKEIREAILEGTVSEETMRLWQQDYTKMVADKMYPVWLEAITAGVKGQPIFDELPPGFSFNTGVPNVVSWIVDRGSAFVTSVTKEQRKAVNALLLKRITDKFTVDELARVIRPCIGLTARQTKANVRYYRSIKERLAKEHPRMKKESIERKAREKQLIYAAKQQRERAYTIAHTEMAFAFNKGMDETIRQAQAEGLMGIMEKRWITAGVDNVCSICQALEGTKIGMDEEFGFPGKVLFPGHKLTPPAHPRCRCAVQYVEVEALDTLHELAGNAQIDFTNITEDGMIDTRDMANGMRKSFEIPLSDSEKSFIRSEINAIGADDKVFEFRDFYPTGYSDQRDKVYVSSSIFPSDDGSTNPTDLLSVRATLAHEYYGHRAYRGTELEKGAWNDEFRASYMAARNCPNLTDEDRVALLNDAIYRARKSGINIKNNKFMLEVLYGFK